MKPLARLFLAAALMISIGLHWNVLQAVAWANMLRDYAAQEGFIKGVVMTFDGEHPCCMCEQITKGKSKQQEDGENPIASDKLSKASEWLGESSPVKTLSDTWKTFLHAHQGSDPDKLVTQWRSTPPKPPPRNTASL